MAHLLTTATGTEPTATQEDPLLDVLLPDLQLEHKYDGFPIITSPMRPYTDHPFVGNVGGQDLSAYINSIIAHQDLEDLLLNPALSKTDEHPTGNADPNPTALLMPSNSSNYKRLPETSWPKSDSDKVLLIQGADGGTGAAHCSSATKILQIDTGDANHYTGGQNDLEPSRGDMTNSDAFNGLEGWAAEPTVQQFTVSNFIDPQQGTAARRIRLVHSIQRASVTEPVLSSHLESEDEAGPCYSTGSSSTNLNKDYANVISQAMVGEVMHIQGGAVIPTQVVSLVEVTGKLRNLSFDEDISPHAKLPHEADLKQRLKQECTKTSEIVREGQQHSNCVPGEPSLRRRRQPAPIGSVVWLLGLALVAILVFVGLWKSSLCKSLH